MLASSPHTRLNNNSYSHSSLKGQLKKGVVQVDLVDSSLFRFETIDPAIYLFFVLDNFVRLKLVF